MQRFCGSPDGVMVCGNADGREVYAVTHDIVPDKGWVMQFKVTTDSKVTFQNIYLFFALHLLNHCLLMSVFSFRSLLAAVCQSVTQIGKFTFSIQ